MTLHRVLDEFREAIEQGGLPAVSRNPAVEMSYQRAEALLSVLGSEVAWRQREIVREIVLAYLPLAKKNARRWVGRGLPFDDLLQEAVLGLLDAIEHFDPRRGVSYAYVANLWIRNRCQRALEAAWRHTPRSVEGEAFDRYLFKRSGAQRSPEDISAEREVYEIAESVLSSREREIVRLRSEGATFSEIADALGVSTQRADQIEKAAMRKIKEQVR